MNAEVGGGGGGVKGFKLGEGTGGRQVISQGARGL